MSTKPRLFSGMQPSADSLHIGNYIGQNYGRIIGIDEDHIDLVELVTNGAGGWMERQAKISLGDTK
jgi:type IV pilus assembly protein PilP